MEGRGLRQGGLTAATRGGKVTGLRRDGSRCQKGGCGRPHQHGRNGRLTCHALASSPRQSCERRICFWCLTSVPTSSSAQSAGGEQTLFPSAVPSILA